MAGNLLPILAIGAGVFALSRGKKKRRKKTADEAPPGPPPIPGEDEIPFPDEQGEPDAPGETGGETGMTGGVHEGPQPGKSVASGIERHYTGAYPWKIIVTDTMEYAGHYYPSGHRGPHEEVVRSGTIEGAIDAFKRWAVNEDRRKRNLPPILVGKKVVADASPQDQNGDVGGGLGS